MFDELDLILLLLIERHSVQSLQIIDFYHVVINYQKWIFWSNLHTSVKATPLVNAVHICTEAVADPGFPVGGRSPVRGVHGPPTQVLFGENVCENERIGSHGGVHPARFPQICQ